MCFMWFFAWQGEQLLEYFIYAALLNEIASLIFGVPFILVGCISQHNVYQGLARDHELSKAATTVAASSSDSGWRTSLSYFALMWAGKGGPILKQWELSYSVQPQYTATMLSLCKTMVIIYNIQLCFWVPWSPLHTKFGIKTQTIEINYLLWMLKWCFFACSANRQILARSRR